MRIEYAKEGGLAFIPALAAPVTIDTSSLPPEQGKAIEELVRQAAFFNLPSDPGPPPAGAADYQTYTITVHDEGRSHTIRVTDLGERPELANLIRALQKSAKEILRRK